MNCTRVEELEDRYLLGELEEEEATNLEWHLRDCLNCAARLSANEEALGQLFAVVEPISPPAHVRSAILEKISKPAPAPVIPIETRKQRRRTALPSIGWVAAVAAALVLGLGFWVINLQNDLATANDQRIEAQRLLDYTSFADTRVWTMFSEGRTDADAPRARMYIRNGSDFFVVTASKLPPVTSGQYYQVWMVRNDSNGKPTGKPELVTKLVLNQQGRANMVVANPSRSADIGTCFVTVENHDTTEPSGPKLLVWNQA